MELVILLQKSEALLLLHKNIKNLLNKTNQNFTEIHTEYLYNQKISEKFDYIPHITLGKISKSQSFSESDKKYEKIIQKIKNQIKDKVFPIIHKILLNHNDLFSRHLTLKKR